jgi:Kef-type K+ transport system membrane component KefB
LQLGCAGLCAGKVAASSASLALLLGLMLIYAWAADVLGSVATIPALICGIMVARHDGITVHDGMAAVGYAFSSYLLSTSVYRLKPVGCWHSSPAC